MPSLEILNIAAYKFVPLLGDLPALRAELLALCQSLSLKGTILLSPEGINLFLAGWRESVDKLLIRLRAVPGLEDLVPKESLSEHQPFTRMLVKVKKEIIAFGIPGIAPEKYTSKRLTARELKAWLDEGRPVTLLDTRNAFEAELGTFRNAAILPLKDFRSFPKVVAALPEEVRKNPVVTFCTGGIRCEKAAPYLESQGFAEVYQLDGGILKYFEDVGGDHYDGSCFVFDQRTALTPDLKPIPNPRPNLGYTTLMKDSEETL